MSQIIDQIFSEVCLDERVKDGIFKLEENGHIDALRDHLVKRGLQLEDAIQITNKMVEGKYPDRQAYRKEDGIIVTWPSPKHKQKAMAENPGKYIEEPEAIRLGLVKKKEPPKEPEPQKDIPTPQGKEEPSKVPQEPGPQSVFQGGHELSVEPIRGPGKPESPPTPPTTPVSTPTSPEEKAAEKEVVKQMIQSDDTLLSSKFHPSIPELYDIANKRGLKEVTEFLKEYVNIK